MSGKFKNDTPSSPVSEAYLTHRSFLKKFLLRFLVDKSIIEEIAQEAFIRSFQAEKTAPIKSPKAFLFQTAKNLALNELEKKSHQLNDYIEDSLDSSVLVNELSAEDQAEGQEKFDIFTRAVMTLPEKCRQVFLLRKVYGYSHKEIAGLLGLSLSTVEKHVAMGLKRCHQFMRDAEKSAVSTPSTAINPKNRNTLG